jgi:hypothetical protein
MFNEVRNKWRVSRYTYIVANVSDQGSDHHKNRSELFSYLLEAIT